MRLPKSLRTACWPCETVTIDGDKHFRLPFPTGETMTILAADSEDPTFPARLAQLCVRQKAGTWARKTFTAAFRGL